AARVFRQALWRQEGGAGNAQLHVAGADTRPGPRWPRRHLQLRGDDVRTGELSPAVSRRLAAVAVAKAYQGKADAANVAGAGRDGRVQRPDHEVPGQEKG